MKPASTLFGLQLGQGCADIRTRSRQVVSRCILPHKCVIRKLSPKIILNETFADNNVAKKDVFTLLLPKGGGAANPDRRA